MITDDGQKEQRKRNKRAKEWKKFREDFMFTQRRLADIVGVSRRTIQQIEAGKVTPHPTTLRLFATFRKIHEVDSDIPKRKRRAKGDPPVSGSHYPAGATASAT